jgi:hypothetical protein
MTPIRASIIQLKKEADKLYSKKLRADAADKNGMVHCYTCLTIKPIKKMQCGHFVSRLVTALRYHPKNTRPQCIACNMFNQGRLDVFAANLIKEYGEGIIEELQELKKKKLTPKETREMLERVIAECSD